MIFALLLLQLVLYNVQGKHFLIETESDDMASLGDPINEGLEILNKYSSSIQSPLLHSKVQHLFAVGLFPVGGGLFYVTVGLGKKFYSDQKKSSSDEKV